jgi:signal transduction histidine kinase
MARLLPWAAVAVVLSGVTANVLRLRADVSLAGPSVTAQALEVVAGATLIVAGGIVGRGPGWWLLPAAGTSWLMTEWASPAAPDAAVFTAGLIAVLAAAPLVLASRWRRPPATRGPGPLLALAVLIALAAAVAGGPLASTAAGPRDAGCTDCGRDLIGLAHDVGLNILLTRLGAQFAVVAGSLAVVWLAVGLIRAWRHRPLAPAAELAADAAAAAFAAAAAIGAAVSVRSGPADPLAYGSRAAAGCALIALSVAASVPALHAARTRRMVAWAAAAVADDPAGGAAGVLAAALNDPGLQVAYPAPGGVWRDQRGQIVVLPERDVTMVTDQGETVAALVHSRAARVSQASVTGAVSAARLLLDTDRIEAGALARVRDLGAARRRVAEAADAARARLERDLHDGAQQRLVALRYALGLAGARAARQPEPVLAARLADADGAAEQALANLRELAHGISAAALDVDGLAGAIRSAAERAENAVTIVELPAERLPGRVERAAYRFVADSLSEMARVSAAGQSIAVQRTRGELIIELAGDHDIADGWPAAYLGDRIAAAGGQFQHTADQGHQRLIAVLPCE